MSYERVTSAAPVTAAARRRVAPGSAGAHDEPHEQDEQDERRRRSSPMKNAHPDRGGMSGGLLLGQLAEVLDESPEPPRSSLMPPAPRSGRATRPPRAQAVLASCPSMTRTVAVGSMKFAVPTATAVAPARRNSTASVPYVTPPIPTIGTLTAFCHLPDHAQCDRLDRRAGKAAHEARELGTVRFSASMAMPSSVLMSETASAPSASTERAISAMSVTLGLSLTMSVRSVTARQARVTAAAERSPSRTPFRLRRRWGTRC